MAMIGVNPDGTYASKCALCGSVLADPIFATSHFMADPSHDLYRFSDAAMHWDCYVRWPDQPRFASMYFDVAVNRSATDPWRKNWSVLLKSADVLVRYGFPVNKVSVVLRKSGSDKRVPREMWEHWLSSGWREDCRPGLEYDAVAKLIPQLADLTLPELPPPASDAAP
jgi:hypothetical protein